MASRRSRTCHRRHYPIWRKRCPFCAARSRDRTAGGVVARWCCRIHPGVMNTDNTRFRRDHRLRSCAFMDDYNRPQFSVDRRAGPLVTPISPHRAVEPDRFAECCCRFPTTRTKGSSRRSRARRVRGIHRAYQPGCAKSRPVTVRDGDARGAGLLDAMAKNQADFTSLPSPRDIALDPTQGRSRTVHRSPGSDEWGAHWRAERTSRNRRPERSRRCEVIAFIPRNHARAVIRRR